VPGALVTTNVELNPEVTNHKESLQHDPKPVPLQVIEDSKTTSSESGEPAGGRPGPVAQQANNSPITLNSSQGKGPTQTADESRSQTVNAMSSTRTVIDSAGLTPKRVTAAISIPQSYFLKIWNKKNAPEAGAPAKMPDPAALDQIRLEETKKISDHVAQLLPSDGTADASQLVKVSTFPDGLTTTEIPLPTTGENVVTWLAEHWTTLGMAALALFALVMLRSMVRSVAAIPSRESAAAAALHAAPGDEAGPVEEQPADKPGAPRLRRYGIAGPSLRDELTQLVQDDPDAAANVLRTWIGSTANNKS
jgi:flagellar M-ring protein FliF